MRNLKRALSLALASVMLLGMMVVGAGAASYTDVDEQDNVEAIEVLNAVNVMIGRQGNFEPDEPVNRHEMAVIMAKLYLGVDIADNYVGTHPYTDVVPWADKYVAACYENGLTSGVTATTYGGGNPLTAVQAAAMMLRALGYKDLSKGATDWRAPVTAMANQIRLFSGVASNPNEKLNRNQVAQLALNTLKSPMVNLKDNTFDVTNGEGQVVISGGSREYIALSSHEAYAKAINRTERAGTSASGIQGYTVELGEHLYNGKLKLNDVTDVFGRPAREWEFDGKLIGDYIKEELMVMDNVGKVTGVDLYNLLGSSTIKEYTLNVSVDGIDNAADYNTIPNRRVDGSNTNVVFGKDDLNRGNKAGVGGTGTGVLTQVFVDHETRNIYVAVINTYLAIADKAYDEKKEEASVKVYDLDKNPTKALYAKTAQNPTSEEAEKFTLGNEDFDLVKDIAKDDAYLVQVAAGAIQTIEPAEVLSGVTISAFKKFDHVVSGGTKYAYTTTADYNHADLSIYTNTNISNLKDITYNIYLDAYGNLIGIKELDSVKNYVFLTSIDRNGSYVSNKTATATAIFPDGTVDTISINMTKSEWVKSNRVDTVPATDENFANTAGDSLLNTWCTYSKNGDVYTVKEVWNNYNPNGATPADKWDPTRAPKSDTNNTTTLAQFNTADTGTTVTEITLKNGLRLRTDYTLGTKFANIYGDSDSVYLTAELGKVVNGGTYGVIKGVEGVFNGIDGTSITVWDKAKARQEAEVAATDSVAEGVYTLYDKDGVVIASVIVGEGSSAKDLVYVHSSGLDLEEDNGGNAKAAGDGLWTWYRKVIRNGEEVTLTEVGDAAEELISMKQYEWYQVKTDGNGNVTNVTPAYKALDVYAGSPNNSRSVYVTDYKQINNAVANTATDTVLYQTDGGPKDYTDTLVDGTHVGFDATQDLEIQGNNILAVTNAQGSGIYFRDNVNVVLQYWNRNVDGIDILVGEGVDDLKDMVKFVNENNKAAKARNATGNRLAKETYYVSALIEDGAATSIVIYDAFNNYERPSIDNITSVTYGNIRIDVVNMTTEGVTGYLDADGDLYIVLPKLTRAVDPDDKYNVEVSVNGVFMGVATFVKATNASVIYSFDGIKMTDKMNIVATVTKKVVEVPVETVSLPSSFTVGLNETSKTLTAAVAPAGADVKSVSWKSSDETVVKVSGTGLTATVTPVAKGKATITVTVDGKTATCPVEVVENVVAITGVTVKPDSASLKVGGTQQLTATVAPVDAVQTVTWTSSNIAVATVSSTGLVTAKAEGTATITATASDGKTTGECTVTVTKDGGGTGENNTTPGLNRAIVSGSEWETQTYKVLWYDKETTHTQITAGEVEQIVKADLQALDFVRVKSVDSATQATIVVKDENGAEQNVTVAIERYWKVSVNGKPVTGTGIVEGAVPDTWNGTTKIKGVTPGRYIPSTENFVLAASTNTDAGDADKKLCWKVAADGELAIDMTSSGVNKDINLMPAVKVDIDASVTNPSIDNTTYSKAVMGLPNQNGTLIEVTTGSWVQSGKALTVSADEAEGKFVNVVAAGKDDKNVLLSTKAGEAAVAALTRLNTNYTFNLSDADATGVIELSKVEGYKVEVKDPALTTTISGIYSSATPNTTDTIYVNYELVGKKYVAVKADVTGTPGAAWMATPVACVPAADPDDASKNVGKIAITSAAESNANKGVITLVPAVKVDVSGAKFNSTGTKILYNANGLSVKAADPTIGTNSYVAVGATIRLITNASSNNAEKDETFIVTIATKDGNVDGTKDMKAVSGSKLVQDAEGATAKSIIEGTYTFKEMPLDTSDVATVTFTVGVPTP